MEITLKSAAAREFLDVDFDKIFISPRPGGWEVFGENFSERNRSYYGPVRITSWTKEDMANWEEFRGEYEKTAKEHRERRATESRLAAERRLRWLEDDDVVSDVASTTYTLPDGGMLVVTDGTATAQRFGCLDGAAVGGTEEVLAAWCTWEKHQAAPERVTALATWLKSSDIAVDVGKLARLLAE